MPAVSEDQTDFQLLAEASVDIICRTGPDYLIKYVSPSCLRILGWTQEEMMQAPPLGFMLPEDAPAVEEAVALAAASKSPISLVTLRMRRKDGSTVWMEVTSRRIDDPVTAEIKEYVTVLRDISERKRYEEQLSAQALTDDLTGLANRRSFDQTLDREWVRTLRDGTHFSLLLIDIDHFKAVNDHYGHQVGDDYLRTIAAALSGALRLPDIVARYGGEEMAVILPSAENKGAVETAERLRAVVADLRLTHEGNAEGGGLVTISIGVATAMARHGGTIKMPESLLAAADNALYKAKQGGRNQVATAVLVAPTGS